MSMTKDQIDLVARNFDKVRDALGPDPESSGMKNTRRVAVVRG